MKLKFKYLLLLGLLSTSLRAQTPGTPMLTTDYFYNFEVYYLLDFDFNNGRNNPDMFSYTLSYAPTDAVTPIKIKLEFEWIANIPAMNISNKRILYVITRPFDFKGELTLTSKDIDQNMRNIYYNDGTPCNISVDHLEQELESLQSIILSTGGKLPAGSYVFTLNITDQNDNFIKGQTQTIEVSNPSTLDLISPGGELEDKFEIATPLPTFQWESIDFMWSKSNCSQCGYSIRVAEYDATKHNSVDQALKDRANLPYPDNGGYYQLPSTPVVIELGLYSAGTIFQYPLTGARPLEAGKTYVWQIKKTYPTTSGSEVVSSPIFAFKIMSTGQTNDMSEFLTLLNQIPDFNPEWFNDGGELYGYIPTGTVTLNDTQILTLENLSALVMQFLTGQITVKSITIE